MSTDEELVRSAWERCRVRFSEPHEGYAQGVYVAEVPMWKTSHKVESEAWSAAAEFTRERLEQVRQVEQEIELLRPSVGSDCEWVAWIENGWGLPEFQAGNIRNYVGWARILAREQATVAELKRGMK